MKLQVPENIPLRWEAWRGFGRPELIASLIITAIATSLAVMYCIISTRESDRMIAVIMVGFTIAFCVGLFSKVEGNQSVFDYLVRQLRYKKEQQIFLYTREKERIAFAEEKN